ncbi:hypothetical protein K437DRAFT_275042 [Tilletiaria anomala UBC 951]|uniref:Condensin complex subunit 1 n=1 Tax=Tilletiaria anomala (strain ATCC 24038 / CBS 436.72 / UBC 951) TaxID=1037660 RepID=A0A066VN47_TILAU|nr:uncharacterized protein K437DRAFT_275042 [Tilletiaria anomala UBC 951]KDN42856.1 hypothetical protein K437DRAFT_275042 [Tilletiaria anomala UBC 951]
MSLDEVDAPEGSARGSRFNLADELLNLPSSRDDTSYHIPNEVQVPDLDATELASTFNTAIDIIASASSLGSDPIISPVGDVDLFDTLRSFLLHFHHLNDNSSLQAKLLDAISTGFNKALEDASADEGSASEYPLHREALEKWGFLMQWLFIVAEREHRPRSGSGTAGVVGVTTKGSKKKGAPALKDGWVWADTLPQLLGLLSKAVRTLQSARIWTATMDRDAFISGCFMRPAFLLLEHETYLKSLPMHPGTPSHSQIGKGNPVKAGITKLICQTIKFHSQAPSALALIIQSLQYSEHLPDYLAELLYILRVEYDHVRLGEEVLREISGKSFSAQDSKSPRSFGRFLVRFGEHNPGTMRKSIAMLQRHLDSESYPLRNAMLETLGLLIKDLVTSDDAAMGQGGDAGQGIDSSANGGGSIGEGAALDSVEARKKQVESFWDLLLERFLDLNSYVRSKTITVCSKLLELPTKFPRQRAELLEVTVRALEDKSSTVRKNAIGLLTKLILTHPYGLMHGGELSKSEWSKRNEQVHVELEAAEKKLSIELPIEEKGHQDEEDGEAEAGDNTPKRRPRKSVVDMEALAASQAELSPEEADKLMKLRLTSRYYTDALAFIDQLSAALPMLSQLLASTSKAEVLEAMDFFRVAFDYKIEGAEAGMRKMIHLIWVKDNTLVMEDGTSLKGIRSKLIEVYRSIYFDPLPDLSPKANVARVTKNMIEMTFGATLAELTSLEQLLHTMETEDLVHEDVIKKLWAVYEVQRPIPKAQRRGAIMVLSMLASARKEIVAERIDSLLRIGLGPLGARDIILAKYTTIALGRVGGTVKKVKGAMSDERVRYPMNHLMFSKLRAAVQLQTPRFANSEWFSLAEHALQAIYLLGEQPDALCAEIVRSMTLHVFGTAPAKSSSRDGSSSSQVDSESEETQDHDISSGTSVGAPTTAPSFAMAQLLFVVGHVALKQIVYIELVEREYKRRRGEADKEKVAKKKSRKGADGASAAAAAAATDELDQVAGNAEDEIGDAVASVREKELLYGERSLLAMFGPMVTHICSNPKSYSNEHLRKAAVLTLCKFMCVSSTFCESNLGLLLQILSTSQDGVIRSNVVIALGDIFISFVGLMNEHSERLYAGLNDGDLGVKKHTLMVLTHLILNGMIKVKGQLGEMAKCLEDEEPRVSDLAKLFFSELSTKENAVYNNLPDIISHLSVGKHAVDEDTFGRTMKFIFTFIDKEKQAESIVEKLCQRFRLASEERQWRDIAFCLSLLPYKSDRSIKKLVEGLPFYQDKLHNQEVYKRFADILAKARSNRAPGAAAAKKDSEAELGEFEALLGRYRDKGEEEEALGGAAKAQVSKAGRKAAAATSSSAGSKPAAAAAGSFKESSNSKAKAASKGVSSTNTSTSSKTNKAPAKRPTRGRRRAVADSEDEEEEDDNDDDDYYA